MVKVGGKVKVANYGQWDGYPTGQGVTVAEFVQAYLMDETLCAEFAAKVSKVRKATKKQLDKMEADWNECEAEVAKARKEGYDHAYMLEHFAWWNRDTGAKILHKIFIAREVPALTHSVAFLEDTLFCEWAYCVDLDKRVVEVYAGDTKPAIAIPFADFTVRRMRTLADEIAHAEKEVA